ncbi:MFS transporter [Tamlana crocina]
MPSSKKTLALIVLAQFCCTSLWFASNGVIKNVISEFNLNENALGHLTSAIQFGFIVGTLIFAVFTISDRFSPSKVFFGSAILGALFNLGICWPENSLISLIIFRFLTGFFLAGIYPVGMKIAADYFEKGLGKSLSFLVGALVLGTAFPHLLSQFTNPNIWYAVILGTSVLSIVGGTLIFTLVPDGPNRLPSKTLDLTSFVSIFRNKPFRSAAFGYFGHMWELYTFWAFVPLVLKFYNSQFKNDLDVSFWAFFIIGIGSLGCVLGGFLSEKFNAKIISITALSLSGFCCLVSPFIFSAASNTLLIAVLLFWGVAVIIDSPLLSTLIAQNASPDKKGTALTIVNCMGYCITIVSIQLTTVFLESYTFIYIFSILAIGPVFGVVSLVKNKALKG